MLSFKQRDRRFIKKHDFVLKYDVSYLDHFACIPDFIYNNIDIIYINKKQIKKIMKNRHRYLLGISNFKNGFVPKFMFEQKFTISFMEYNNADMKISIYLIFKSKSEMVKWKMING